MVTSSTSRCVRVDVDGTVQGVGFRPFVYRLATSLRLAGSVRNESTGVAIELEGEPASIDEFLTRLVADAPLHARIGRVAVADVAASAHRGFQVVDSGPRGLATAFIPPDLCTCAACLSELFDPTDRRHRYPFINCTACGPRFTIARAIPYDRAATTMAAFTMCSICQAEYDDPANRRFHAEPNACPACGPRVSLLDRRGSVVHDDDAHDVIDSAARALMRGEIVAVKGIGGFHLACRADDSSVVSRLRRRKHRDDKPFAIMTRGLAEATRLVQLGDLERDLLTGAARPIVIANRTPDARVASAVAPGRDELGVMLPYSPLHHLLMADLEMPLVMTSGNVSDEPIAYRDDDALGRLGEIADHFLVHDRPIEARCEDSVVRVVRVNETAQSLFIRRARGFVPAPLEMPWRTADGVVAVGGQLKNTACVANHAHAVVGPHAGDLGEARAFSAYVAGVDHLIELSGARPTIVAHDMHPDYASTRYAAATELGAVAVQHHHAHLAACLAEHGETGLAVGVIFDGAGYGTDGTIWGGEILFGDLGRFSRVGHLRVVKMPGGDVAVHEPWRMACAWLTDAHDGLPSRGALSDSVDDAQWNAVSRLSRTRLAPSTTSVGRLLDACAAICGIRARVTYEGQAAIELEALARGVTATSAYRVSVTTDRNEIILDPRELILAVERDVLAGVDCAEISSRIHGGLVYATTAGAESACKLTGARTVVLSGGVFQNVLLIEGVSTALARAGLRVLVPRQLPPNDGGLSYGQAVVAACQRRDGVPGDSGTGR